MPLCGAARPAASTGLAYSGMVPTVSNPSTALPSAAPTSATHSEQATSQLLAVGSLAAAVVSGGVPAALPSSIDGRHWPAPALLGNNNPHSGVSSLQGKAYTMPERPAPTGPALAPRDAKRKALQRPYEEFCRAHRPSLPTSLRNAERERVLGQMWGALPEAKRAAKWGATPPAPTAATLRHHPARGPPVPSRAPFPVQRPVHRVTPDRRVAFPAQQTAPLADRWAGLGKAKEAKAAAGPASGERIGRRGRHRATALLKAAVAHRTFVEQCLRGQHQPAAADPPDRLQQQLAEMMDQQLTGEEAIEVAISIGMPAWSKCPP